MIGTAERAALWSAAMGLGLLSFVLPALHDGPATGWQLVAGVVGLTAVGFSPWQPSIVVAAGALTFSVGVGMASTSFPLPTVAAAGVTGLATFEAMALLRIWTGAGRCQRHTELVHLAASARRCAIGAAAAAAVMLLGAVELPAPGIIVTAGLAAAAAVVVVSTRRAG